MAITIRRATVYDLEAMQDLNLQNLPENYELKYYMYHILTWPQLNLVATTCNNDLRDVDMDLESDKILDIEKKKEKSSRSFSEEKLIGYILAKMDDDLRLNQKNQQGHITSISVSRTYRKLGIARKLMEQTLNAFSETFNAKRVTLHVRVSNINALKLYKEILNFKEFCLEKSYYNDGEDAHGLMLNLESGVFKDTYELDEFFDNF